MGRMAPGLGKNPYASLNPENVKRQASTELDKMRQAGLFDEQGEFRQKNLGPVAREYLKNLQEGARTGQMPRHNWYKMAKMEQDREGMYSGGGTGGPMGGGFFRQTTRPNPALQRYSKARSGQNSFGRALGL